MALRGRTPAEKRARAAGRAEWAAAKAGVEDRHASDENPAAAEPPPVEVPMRSKTTPTIVRSTTRRPPRAPVQERRSDVLLPTYLAWVREQPCVIEVQDAATCASRAVQPHHWPTTGANGRQVDTLVLPACWACHRACHTGAVPGETQEAAAWRSWARFWRFAPVAVQRQVARELAASLDA